MSSPPPRRRWLQFSLRTLLSVVTLAAFLLGYVAWEREQCRRGEEALHHVQRIGIGIGPRDIIDVDWGDFLEEAKPSSSRPEWLQGILGNDRFRLVKVASFNGDTITDADLRHLEALPNVREVDIHALMVTENGLAHLRGRHRLEKFSFIFNRRVSAESWELLEAWPQLQELSLRYTDFGDEGIQHVARLTHLRQLDLRNTKITDAGLESLAPLTSLEVLDLAGTDVTDDGLRHLSKLTNLRKLNLAETDVVGPGLASLATLPRLESLLLYRCPVTDGGLVSLAELRSLRELGLSLTEVTDAGLANLGGLSNLQNLGLSGAKISNAGLPHIGRLRNLESLGLAGTLVSDQGMSHLAHLSYLKKLFLHNTYVTFEGESILSMKSPVLSIDRINCEDALEEFDPYALTTKPFQTDPFEK